ncbi:MAG: hypothetical protein R3B72_28215 [Polyangiaceae bacterium]
MKSQRFHKWLHRPTQGRRIRAVLALVTSAVLLSAMLMGGSAYAYCPHMQRVSAGCCHGSTSGPSEAPGSEKATAPRGPEVGSPCCESRVVSELPSADRAPSDFLSTAPLAPAIEPVSIELPAALFFQPQAARAQVRAPIRAGPLTALERCVLLQTFLR